MIDRKFLTNQKLEKILLETQKDLYAGNKGITLLQTIEFNFPNAKNAHLLQWLPEQGEDIFWVLVDPTIVAIIEIPRPSNELSTNVVCEVMNVKDYLKRSLSIEVKRKTELALRLMRQQYAG